MTSERMHFLFCFFFFFFSTNNVLTPVISNKETNFLIHNSDSSVFKERSLLLELFLFSFYFLKKNLNSKEITLSFSSLRFFYIFFCSLSLSRSCVCMFCQKKFHFFSPSFHTHIKEHELFFEIIRFHHYLLLLAFICFSLKNLLFFDFVFFLLFFCKDRCV